MIVTRLSVEDAPAAAELIETVVGKTPHLKDHPGTLGWLHDWYSVESLTAKIRAEYGLAVRDESGGLEGVGFVDLVTGYITGVYVLDQGHGYGSYLIAYLLEHLDKPVAAQAFMHLHPDSAMRYVAEKFGFRDVGPDPSKVYFPDEDYRVYSR